jgi:hypothetical protein
VPREELGNAEPSTLVFETRAFSILPVDGFFRPIHGEDGKTETVGTAEEFLPGVTKPKVLQTPVGLRLLAVQELSASRELWADAGLCRRRRRKQEHRGAPCLRSPADSICPS